MDSTTLSKLVQRTAADLVPVAALESGRLVFANAAFHRLFGLHTAGAAIEPELVALVSGPADGDPLQRITRAIDESDGETTRLDLRGTRADGSVVELDVTGRRVQLGASSAIVAVASDVTRSRRALEQLDRISMHDPLTGLPNRSLFTDRLSSLLRVSSRSGEPFAVMFGDLDGFKAVNDGHGHETGDAVLRVVARRLRSCLRDTDTVARIGGDEFAVLLPLAHSAGDATAIATRLVAAVRAPIVLGQRTCSVGLSIGIATYPAAAIDADSLLAGADAAMYRVKSAGKDGYA
ncbi:MAG: GGDEF domain-containing protein, partial [Deltaproteobacteria bacterium]|nr:GGDEF domain-containing protein [Deltaproteobacteria bacterium]